jgi:hypothetical protein
MKGDYTRFTHRPGQHYRNVLLQQGRVQLDADWNEQAEIRDLITRTTTADVIGPSGAPENGGGFAIGVTAGGDDLTISAGRIYVDGILCEADGDATYAIQLHWPAPDELLAGIEATTANGRTDLVFLDVWQRHVTAVEDPALLDPALNGIDTATRVQAVWQVRVLKNVGDVTCPNVPGFPLSPSGGTITVGADATPSDADPCDVVVAGGYRGVENRLYRIEIHDGGALGTATWKWSRDNGSVVLAIETFIATPANQVRLAALGRDRVLTLHEDDWIEIADDASELGFLPAFTAQIDSINEATRVVTLDRDVPAGLFDQSRNPRIRRWDQTTGVDGDGILVTGTGPFTLEDGIRVEFGGADFRAGDYWTFAARVASGTVDTLTTAPPVGIRHHYAPLALIRWTGPISGPVSASVLEDCRETFPPLTDLCADDICFDNGNCGLDSAETVQEALDRLCAARDLRFHNKHLHGWGIVCGLQVACGPNEPDGTRRQVTLRSGYAIDCQGDDLVVDDDVSLDLMDRIEALDAIDPDNPILNDGDGEVCLVLAASGQGPGVEVERFTPPAGNLLQQALEGTLLRDFFDHCIQRVIDFLREETRTDDQEGAKVSQGQRKLSALLNLLIQIPNPVHGRFVWLSEEDDRLLREFYQNLRALLTSQTFCAMFENARPLPAYPFSGGVPDTVYAKGHHTRLRLRPNSNLAYTVGAGDAIHAYDLATGELTGALTFPGGDGVVVQDIAFSQNGNEMYAVATLNQDTLFIVADTSGTDHRFRPVTVMRDVHLVTLATSPRITRNVYAIGRGKGFFEINPDSPPNSPQPRYPFDAAGQIALEESTGEGFATARTGRAAGELYDAVQRFDLRGNRANTINLVDQTGVNRVGSDDLAVVTSRSSQQPRLYVVADPTPGSNQKDVLVFDSPRAGGPSVPIARIPIDNTEARLMALGSTMMLVALQDSYHIVMIDTATDTLVQTTTRPVQPVRVPVQIGPSDMVFDAARRQVAVLNSASNTVTRVPAALFAADAQVDLDALAAYRDATLAAFTDLAGGFLQYLKDCFCDHLLVNCPDCEDDDRVYLGCVSIRDNQVYRVCNFSKRKYVKTFPTVGYWLSLVPILPLLRVAVEKLCCAVLPDLFSRFQPAAPTANRRDRFRAQPIRHAAVRTRGFDVSTLTRDVRDRFDFGRTLTTNWFDSMRAQPVATTTRPAARTDVVGQPVDVATTRIEAVGATVARIERFDASAGLGNVLRFTRAPTSIPTGTTVILYQDDQGVVRGFEPVRATAASTTVVTGTAGVLSDEAILLREEISRVSESVTAFDDTRTDLASTRSDLLAAQAEIATMRAEIARIETDSANALASRDAEIANLRSTTASLTNRLSDVDTLRSNVNVLMRRGPTG